MNDDFDSKFDDVLYDQDIGVEIKIDIPQMKYEPVTKIEEIREESLENELLTETKEYSKIEYELATNIDEVEPEKTVPILKENDLLKEIEASNVFNKAKQVKEEKVEAKPEVKKEHVEVKKVSKKIKEKPKKETKKKKEKLNAKVKLKKEKSLSKKSKAKVDNSYTVASTYLIILIIICSFASISLVLISRDRGKKSSVIQLIGEETIVLNEKDTYVEPGFIAIDFNQGDVTKDVIVDNNVINGVPGIYKVTYKLKKDNILATRNVVITNNNDIELKLSGNQTVFSKLNDSFIEDGYSAIYNSQDYSDKVKIFGEVILNKTGLYKLYYVIQIDNNVKALSRNVVVYAGDLIDGNNQLVEEINNHIIDEVHYSNQITLDNINESVLLYFGALNCKDLSLDGINSCLNELFKVNTINLKEKTKYSGKNAEILFDKNENKFIIKRLDLPRNIENIYKVIVEGDNIFVYEKYAYEVLINNKEVCDGKTKKFLYSGVDKTFETGYETCVKECNDCEVIRTRKNNETLYLHTFKKVLDKYVWSKTEMLK